MTRLSLLLIGLLAGQAVGQTKGRDRGRFSLQGSAPAVFAVDGAGKVALTVSESGQAVVWPMDQKAVVLLGFNVDRKDDATVKKGFVANRRLVTGAVFLPDGKRFAVACTDGTVRLFDTAAGLKHLKESEKAPGDAPPSPEPVKTLSAHVSQAVVALAVAADGKTLLTAGSDAAVKVWDVETWKLLHTLKDVHGIGGVKAVQFAPDGRRFATAGADKTAKIWEMREAGPKLQFKLDGHEGAVCLAFSPDGKRLATGSGAPKKSGSVRVWDTETGKVDYKLEGPQDAVTAVLFSTKGDYLAAGGLDLKVLVFSLADKMVKYTDDHAEPPKGFITTPDGNLFGLWSKTALRWFTGLGK